MVSKIGGKDKSFFLPGKPIIKIFASLQKNPGQTKWVCPGTGYGIGSPLFLDESVARHAPVVGLNHDDVLSGRKFVERDNRPRCNDTFHFGTAQV